MDFLEPLDPPVDAFKHVVFFTHHCARTAHAQPVETGPSAKKKHVVLKMIHRFWGLILKFDFCFQLETTSFVTTYHDSHTIHLVLSLALGLYGMNKSVILSSLPRHACHIHEPYNIGIHRCTWICV